MSQFLKDLCLSLSGARRKHTTPINSTHQAYALIKEELDEYWDELRLREGQYRHRLQLYYELLDIAAVCQRAAEDLGLEQERP